MVSHDVQKLAVKFHSDHKLTFILRNWLDAHRINRDMMNACLALMIGRKEPTEVRYLWPFVLIEHYLEHYLLDCPLSDMFEQESPKEIGKAKRR